MKKNSLSLGEFYDFKPLQCSFIGVDYYVLHIIKKSKMADPLLSHDVIQRQEMAYAYVTNLKRLCAPQYAYIVIVNVTALMLYELRRNGRDEYTQKKRSTPLNYTPQRTVCPIEAQTKSTPLVFLN